MARKSAVERLWEVNKEAEIWWDSSPLVFANWRKKLIAEAADKQEMTARIDRLYHEDNDPTDNLFRGVTTNPPLSYAATQDNPDYWNKWVGERVEETGNNDVDTVFWDTYKEIVKRGAETYMPMFEASSGKLGFISGQTDPRVRHDVDKMVSQGVELHSISPNVMVKAPGTAEGYEAIRILTSKGIATNNTLSFIIPQFVACMNAVSKGLNEAKANGVDLSQWRSVITAMSARYGTLGDLAKDAETAGIKLSEEDIRWSEIAIFKKACRLVEANDDYQGKMLLCSMRCSPIIDGKPRSWHVEKVAGCNAVYTCPPSYLEEMITQLDHVDFEHEIDNPVPTAVMDKLMKLPYFARGYAEDGYKPEEFGSHPALAETAKQFSAVTEKMVDFVRDAVKRVA
jgi:transaldolase